MKDLFRWIGRSKRASASSSLGKKTYFTDTILIEVEFTTRKKAIQTGFEDTMSPFLVAITTSWAWNVSITRAES
jgi:hypothetical protein